MSANDSRKSVVTVVMRVSSVVLAIWTVSIVPFALVSEQNPATDPESLLEGILRVVFGLSFFVAFAILIVVTRHVMKKAERHGLSTSRLKFFCWIFGPFGCAYTVIRLTGDALQRQQKAMTNSMM